MKDEQTILAERAKMVAGWKTALVKTGESLLVVEFQLIPEPYCIDNRNITEVVRTKEITPVPGAPPFVLGVMNVRGKIISIVNFKIFFNLKLSGITEMNKIIIIKHDQMECGIVTDMIYGTKEIMIDSLRPPPITLNGIGAGYIQGVTPDGLILLNIPAILTSEMLIVNQ